MRRNPLQPLVMDGFLILIIVMMNSNHWSECLKGLNDRFTSLGKVNNNTNESGTFVESQEITTTKTFREHTCVLCVSKI